MTEQSALSRKLLIRPGNCLLVLGAPKGYPAQLEPLPEGAGLQEAAEEADQVQLFVRDLAALRAQAARALAAVKRGGVLWIVYPKQMSGIKTDINRDTCWAAMQDTGWRPVTQVAVDEVWSALRFRPVEDVKTRKEPRTVS